MKASARVEGPVTVIAVSGQLLGGPDAGMMRRLIRESLEGGRKHIVVDVGEVSWVNSTGLGILIASHVTVAGAGGQLKLARVSHRISQILMVTKLRTVFETYDSVEQAMRGFPG